MAFTYMKREIYVVKAVRVPVRIGMWGARGYGMVDLLVQTLRVSDTPVTSATWWQGDRMCMTCAVCVSVISGGAH